MNVVKTLVKAGIFGAIGYYIVKFVFDLLITATDTVTTFFGQVVPLAMAFGIVWVMISAAFKGGD